MATLTVEKGRRPAAIRATVWAVCLLLMNAFVVAQVARAATWAPLTNLNPGGSTQIMLLLTDGRVLVQAYDGKTWTILTPDIHGSYIAGTWTTTGSSVIPRIYFTSQVLPNGKVWVLGGEYSGTSLSENLTNTAEIYDPVAGTWTAAANFPLTNFGDDPSMLLPNNQILAGYIFSAATYLYNWSTNSWTTGPTKVNNDRSDEEGWLKQADGSVLTYDLFESVGTGGSYAETYSPTTNSWSDHSPSAGTAAGTIPLLSSSALGYEMGPSLRLQDGRAFEVGATQHTALFNPTTNTWAAGPDTLYNSLAWGSDDAPGAAMPNGHVLYAADAAPQFGSPFHAPTQLFDFNPTTNTVSEVSTSFDPNLAGEASYPTRMLMLPTGQVLFSDDGARLYVYTPDGGPALTIRPVINSIVYNGSGVFTLTGQRLNGQSAGATYGDDDQMDSNYPLVRLTNTATGNVYYAKSTNWSSVGVGGGSAAETVNFTLSAATPAGDYSVLVSGAGIQGIPVALNVTAAEAAAQ